MRRMALVALVLAMLTGGLGLTGQGTAHADHDYPLGHPCDIDIFIVDFQFTYQTCFRVAGQVRYTPVTRPAFYVSVPYNRPIPVEDHPPRTYWFRNITNLDPVTHTFAQCTSGWGTPTCKNNSAAALFGPIELEPGERHTFPPASNEDAGFPDCVKNIRFMSLEHPWMQGWVDNEGWFLPGHEPC